MPLNCSLKLHFIYYTRHCNSSFFPHIHSKAAILFAIFIGNWVWDAKWDSPTVTWLVTGYHMALQCDNKSNNRDLSSLGSHPLVSLSLSEAPVLCLNWLTGFNCFKVTYQKPAQCFLCNNWFSLYSCNPILFGFNKVNECFNQDFLQYLICFLRNPILGLTPWSDSGMSL